MLTEVFLICVIGLFAYFLYNLFSSNAERIYFEPRKIKYQSRWKSLSNLFKLLTNQYTAIDFAVNSYNEFPGEPIYGVLDTGRVRYFVNDLELIKKISIKDFDHFEDHDSFTDEKTDKLWGNSLFLMKGQRWRQMRATLSPAFTGRKMRQMYELVSDCAEDVIAHIKQRFETEARVNIEMKDFFTRYTNDVIASCAFGLKINSLAEPNNQFYLDGRKLTNFTGTLQIFKVLLTTYLPKVARLMGVRFTDPLTFKSMVLDTMQYRKEHNISRPDMINIMMQVREGSLQQPIEEKSKRSDEGFATVEESDVGKVAVTRVWNDDELVAQCFLFFVAGFETTSVMLEFSSYELVANPDIQQKLYDEIAETNKQIGGKRIDYETLQKMKYLDQFVSEVLRKWTPAPQLDRVCVKDYVLNDGDKLDFKIEKGSAIHIPVYAIHHNPKYYPDPEKFNPDRFSEENKKDIIPGTYLSFGSGPRNCIGSRFALMEIKAILYHLLLNYSFEANGKTVIPAELKKSAFSMTMKNGMHLELKRRLN